MIKLLIGGSPCTKWSIAQTRHREVEPSGIGWELFRNYLIAKEKFKPDFFLYENNKSAAQSIKDQIGRALGVPLIDINSKLVSAQNRQRFYAFNWTVDQPKDRKILLRDILVTSACYSTRGEFFSKPVYVGELPGQTGTYRNGEQASQQYRVYSVNGKSVACDQDPRKFIAEPLTPLSEREIEYMVRPTKDGRNHFDFAHFHDGNQDKARCITATISKGVPYNVLCEPVNARENVYEVRDGFITLKGKRHPIKLADGYYLIRKLTPVECERLQTLPDGYTEGVSNTQRLRGLGNGWTAEVIIHILNGALKDTPKDEKIVVLSMYDGIGTGRYCLDKMGFTNVTYYAYEIDKYAKQIAMKNYPDIIQCGDAFDLRTPGWCLPREEDDSWML